ncbi:MAG: tetratricopeptide repeat protein [Planctomycetes bacterium]|nr:tetratricopeptide repeat protein [Planctomycetota bacterium]
MTPRRRSFGRRPDLLAAVAALALAAAAFAVALPSRRARADDAPSAEERAEAVDRQVQKGWAAFRRGNHEEALARAERLEKLDPGNPVARVLKARVFARTGRYEEGLALAEAAVRAAPGDLRSAALRYDFLLRLGRLDEALSVATAAIAEHPDDLVARTVRGQVLEARGRRKEALADFDQVIAAYNARDPRPEEIPSVATAALRATRLSPNAADDLTMGALNLLKQRIEAEPEDVDLLLAFADVYRANPGTQGQSIAGKYYKKVLDQNPMVAEARVGQARIALVFYRQDQAVQACRTALQVNQNLVPAMNVLAAIHVGDGDYDQADAMWERARKVNALDKEARSVRAARLYITGDRAGFAALEKELLAEDPTYGALYTTVAELVGERQRRFDVAAELSSKAIETDPTDPRAYVVAGENLMNLGREAEAKAAFQKGVAASKGWQDVVRDNFLEVLDVLETFVEAKTEHFVVRQHPEEAAVVGPYLLPLLEESRAALQRKYGFECTSPILVESFHRSDDFSTRSVGTPGLPAIGVCFGQVITLAGPLSGDLGAFSWARTAWHEYAHVVTLQMSKGQVPRWLTEGLSVHEEKAHKAQWGREMDRELYDRWRNGRLLRMAEINHAFRGPDILFAYFQGGLIADYVSREWGFEAITKMLRRFADDVPTEKVFEEVLKVPLKDFDARFSKYVEELVGAYRMQPRWDDESKKSFEARTEKDPADAEAWTRLAWAHHQRGNAVDAGAALEKARRLAPDAPEVVLLQAETAMRANRLDLAAERYRKFLSLGGDDVGARLALARIALGDKKSAEAVEHYEAAKKCFPRFVGKGNPYVALAELRQGEGDAEGAMKELEAYAEIAQEDWGVRKKLLAWYVSRKDDAAVARVCAEMIEISPFGASRGKKPDLEVHARFAEVLERAGKKREAAREWKVQSVLVDRLPEEERKKAGGVEARLALGRLLLELGQPDEAVDAALGALAIDPESVAAKALKAQATEAAVGK